MIWHLLPLPGWRSAADERHLARPGPGSFVHASPDERTALAVANAFFAQSAEPLVALGLDESRISAPIRYEAAGRLPPGAAPGTRFPHVYGPVETAAVTQVRFARRDPSGRYTGLERRPGTAGALDLVPHPEGGWFRQTWEAGPAFEPAGYRGERSPATAIYFLLTPGAESCWHRVRSDEVWLWHRGGPLTLRIGGSRGRPGEHAAVTLGPDLAGGQHPQYVVPGGRWQSARPAAAGEVLVTCIVSPGFDFADFEAAAGA